MYTQIKQMHIIIRNYGYFASTVTLTSFCSAHAHGIMDHRKMSVIVLLDMSKAFDSIQHDLMLHKLRNIGL